MIKSMLSLLILCLAFCSLISIITFLVDVIKWHDKEVKADIKPSKTKDDENESQLSKIKDYTESEVSNIGDDDGKYNTSAFLGSGL